MLIVDQLRGAHSTGAFSVRRMTDDIYMAKEVGTPDALIESRGFEKVLATSHRALIGHNRFATQGKVTRANAHPFDFDNIIGVHNGSLSSYSQLDGYNDHPVDSHVLYQHINNHGLRDAVDNCWGAMALVWWDKEAEELNMFRNDQRPMHYGATKEGAIIIGSEFGMVDWICDRNNVTLESLEVFPADMHLRFHIPMKSATCNKPTAEVVKRKPYVAPFPVSNVSPNVNGNVLTPAHVPLKGQVLALTPPSKVQQPDKKVMDLKEGVFEVISNLRVSNIDGWECQESAHPGVTFLLVKTSQNVDIRIGDLVITDVAGHVVIDKVLFYTLKLKGLLHVEANTIHTTADVLWPAEGDEGDSQPVGTFFAPNGRPIDSKSWHQFYGTCAHCSGDTEYETCVSLPQQDAVICNECASDPVIRDAISLS